MVRGRGAERGKNIQDTDAEDARDGCCFHLPRPRTEFWHRLWVVFPQTVGVGRL